MMVSNINQATLKVQPAINPKFMWKIIGLLLCSVPFGCTQGIVSQRDPVLMQNNTAIGLSSSPIAYDRKAPYCLGDYKRFALLRLPKKSSSGAVELGLLFAVPKHLTKDSFIDLSAIGESGLLDHLGNMVVPQYLLGIDGKLLDALSRQAYLLSEAGCTFKPNGYSNGINPPPNAHYGTIACSDFIKLAYGKYIILQARVDDAQLTERYKINFVVSKSAPINFLKGILTNMVQATDKITLLKDSILLSPSRNGNLLTCSWEDDSIDWSSYQYTYCYLQIRNYRYITLLDEMDFPPLSLSRSGYHRSSEYTVCIASQPIAPDPAKNSSKRDRYKGKMFAHKRKWKRRRKRKRRQRSAYAMSNYYKKFAVSSAQLEKSDDGDGDGDDSYLWAYVPPILYEDSDNCCCLWDKDNITMAELDKRLAQEGIMHTLGCIHSLDDLSSISEYISADENNNGFIASDCIDILNDALSTSGDSLPSEGISPDAVGDRLDQKCLTTLKESYTLTYCSDEAHLY